MESRIAPKTLNSSEFQIKTGDSNSVTISAVESGAHRLSKKRKEFFTFERALGLSRALKFDVWFEDGKGPRFWWIV
jgi:hypothetical protein